MTEAPKKRVLRDLRQVEEEELERLARYDEWVEEMRTLGCPYPEEPEVYAKWKTEQESEEAEGLADITTSFEWIAEEEAELKRIKDSRPLGVPPSIEPRSVHSPVPQPLWKRKLRP
jgi:hypothetical protein